MYAHQHVSAGISPDPQDSQKQLNGIVLCLYATLCSFAVHLLNYKVCDIHPTVKPPTILLYKMPLFHLFLVSTFLLL